MLSVRQAKPRRMRAGKTSDCREFLGVAEHESTNLIGGLCGVVREANLRDSLPCNMCADSRAANGGVGGCKVCKGDSPGLLRLTHSCECMLEGLMNCRYLIIVDNNSPSGRTSRT